MANLPVMVGFGGISSAGRSSLHNGYRRLIIDALEPARADQTYRSLAALMGLETASGELSASQRHYIFQHTLIRRIEAECFDVEAVPYNKRLMLNGSNGSTSFVTRARDLPAVLPANWTVAKVDEKNVRVDISGSGELLTPATRSFPVHSASQLPSGFNPGALYPSRNHPRGLEMAVYGASDAVQSLGLDWQAVCSKVRPDQISVYSASCMGQLDPNGHGGMLGARYNDKRTTSKHCPFGMAEMPADFINAYVLGTMGNTGGGVGACATFLYNLRQGIADIQRGLARVVVVGSSEAPLVPDVMDGYATMGALATAQELLELDRDKGVTEPDLRRASRPFSSNCGFTIAESSQYVVLMDDALAMELGANVLGAVTDVFVSADGHKKSISAPGIGNYVTMAKAVASARALLGDEAVRRRSYVQAHGTSTPQNRVTESHILNETAKTFGIEQWPVAAVKAYLGHSLGAAGGDQLMVSLGVWADGVIPGIATIDHVADDVHSSHLHISPEHHQVGTEGMDVAFINSKGFGGNNASATLVAPHIVNRMLQKRYGSEAFSQYQARNAAVREQSQAYDAAATRGEAGPIYKFDHQVMSSADITFSKERISVPGYGAEISLDGPSPYSELI